MRYVELLSNGEFVYSSPDGKTPLGKIDYVPTPDGWGTYITDLDAGDKNPNWIPIYKDGEIWFGPEE